MKYWEWVKSNPRIVLVVFIGLIGLMFFRFDYYYSLRSYKVWPGESLTSVLNRKVFHDDGVTHLSYKYLSESNLPVDINYIQANQSLFGQDGYIVQINQGLMTIVGPNENLVLKNVPLLPEYRLYNHMVLVVYNDIIIILLFVAFIWMALKIKLELFKKLSIDLAHILSLVIVTPLALLLIIILRWILHLGDFSDRIFSILSLLVCIFSWILIGRLFQKKSSLTDGIKRLWLKGALSSFFIIILLLGGLPIVYQILNYHTAIGLRIMFIRTDVFIYQFSFIFTFLLYYFTGFLFVQSIKHKNRDLAISGGLCLISLFVFNASLSLLK